MSGQKKDSFPELVGKNAEEAVKVIKAEGVYSTP